MTYTQFLNLAQTRRSVRKFSERSVSRDNLLAVLEAARWAPSNHNRQPWRFIVLEQRQQIERLAEQVGRSLSAKMQSLPAIASAYAAELTHYATFFAGAPAVILTLHKRPVSVSDALLRGVRDPALVSGEPLSVAMAVQNMLLAAHALGLGTCVLTAPLIVEQAILAEVRPPPSYDLTCLVAVGHPAETPPAPRRKSIEQILEFRKDSSGSESK
jgi:coenzyme F420-0:L-glutamate ligase / coenzyme F420-1:gamma-L-glutamate ligase